MSSTIKTLRQEEQKLEQKLVEVRKLITSEINKRLKYDFTGTYIQISQMLQDIGKRMEDVSADDYKSNLMGCLADVRHAAGEAFIQLQKWRHLEAQDCPSPMCGKLPYTLSTDPIFHSFSTAPVEEGNCDLSEEEQETLKRFDSLKAIEEEVSEITGFACPTPDISESEINDGSPAEDESALPLAADGAIEEPTVEETEPSEVEDGVPEEVTEDKPIEKTEDEKTEDEKTEDEGANEEFDFRIISIIEQASLAGHTRIVTRMQEGVESIKIDDQKGVFRLGSIALNGGERNWLNRCIREVCGDQFVLG